MAGICWNNSVNFEVKGSIGELGTFAPCYCLSCRSPRLIFFAFLVANCRGKRMFQRAPGLHLPSDRWVDTLRRQNYLVGELQSPNCFRFAWTRIKKYEFWKLTIEYTNPRGISLCCRVAHSRNFHRQGFACFQTWKTYLLCSFCL